MVRPIPPTPPPSGPTPLGGVPPNIKKEINQFISDARLGHQYGLTITMLQWNFGAVKMHMDAAKVPQKLVNDFVAFAKSIEIYVGRNPGPDAKPIGSLAQPNLPKKDDFTLVGTDNYNAAKEALENDLKTL